MPTALVLMAHGSRRPEANDDLVALADSLRGQQLYSHVVASFLELAEPDIVSACRSVVSAGADRVIMVPYFLSAGVHVLRDLAGFRDQLAGEFPHIDFRLAEPLGRHPLLQEIVKERADEAGRSGEPSRTSSRAAT